MQQTESNHVKVSEYTLPLSHALHGGYKHPACRKWIKQSVTADNLVYPIFVLDIAEAVQPIVTMPGVARYGYESIIGHLAPLVQKVMEIEGRLVCLIMNLYGNRAYNQ